MLIEVANIIDCLPYFSCVGREALDSQSTEKPAMISRATPHKVRHWRLKITIIFVKTVFDFVFFSLRG